MPVATMNSGVHNVLKQRSRAVIEAELIEMTRWSELGRAVRDAVQSGLSIDEVSDATGLPPADIRKMVSDNQAIEIDLNQLTGL